jgi:hypothetical protein
MVPLVEHGQQRRFDDGRWHRRFFVAWNAELLWLDKAGEDPSVFERAQFNDDPKAHHESDVLLFTPLCVLWWILFLYQRPDKDDRSKGC